LTIHPWEGARKAVVACRWGTFPGLREQKVLSKSGFTRLNWFQRSRCEFFFWDI
jgi:hypothetical protein